MIKQFVVLFWSVVAFRLVSIFLLPLTDTTEARYANTALMMSQLNDWITPFIRYQEPFLGKPPFAFWMEAVSYKIFGIADFVPRLPSLLITLATVWLIYRVVSILHDKLTAVLASLIYISTLSVFILSGVVMTDPFLVFGTTLSLVAFLLVVNGYKNYWRYLFFVGGGIGVLTKGPLAIVIIGGVIVLWILLDFKERIQALKLFPWFSGLLLMFLIFTPWYIAQEIKNPGFLYYFIIGENLGRFLDSGWSGDKYGYVHKEARGMIWLYWFGATLPWSIIAISFLIKNIKALKEHKIVNFLKDKNISFYLIWALFIMIFFTFGGNTLWYYTLPSIGGFAILLALYMSRKNGEYLKRYLNLIKVGSFFIPVISIVAVTYIMIYPNSVKTEKFLIEKYKISAKKSEPIYFIGKTSFSAAYYMNTGKNLKSMSIKEYQIVRKTQKKYFLLVRKDLSNKLDKSDLKVLGTSKDYILFKRDKESTI